MTTPENYPRISPFLWFDNNAEQAVDFYLSIFKNSRKLNELRSPVEYNRPDGSVFPKNGVLTIAFELDGQKFTAMNGGPGFKFNESISLVVRCETQQEIDHYWQALTEGGHEVQCGWLKDKFGLSWQVVPSRIGELLKTPAAMQAMMKMKKLNIAELEQASQS